MDLSDEEKWVEQLTELEKLPPFLRVSCRGGGSRVLLGRRFAWWSLVMSSDYNYTANCWYSWAGALHGGH